MVHFTWAFGFEIKLHCEILKLLKFLKNVYKIFRKQIFLSLTLRSKHEFPSKQPFFSTPSNATISRKNSHKFWKTAYLVENQNVFRAEFSTRNCSKALILFVAHSFLQYAKKKTLIHEKNRTKIAVASNVFHSKLSQRGVASPHAVCDESQQTMSAPAFCPKLRRKTEKQKKKAGAFIIVI